MSREIKFRVWDIDHYEEDSSFWIYQSGQLDHDSRSIGSQIVEQYTGLKDKNGKEIYEGDVLKLEDFIGNNYTDKVKWDEASAGFWPFIFKEDPEFYDGRAENYNIEVIGNIHENPELLDG